MPRKSPSAAPSASAPPTDTESLAEFFPFFHRTGFWPAFPFRWKKIERTGYCGQVKYRNRPKVVDIGGQGPGHLVKLEFALEPSRDCEYPLELCRLYYYVPTDDDQQTLLKRYPGINVMCPPWEKIEADLIRNGETRVELEELLAPLVMAKLQFYASEATTQSSEGAVTAALRPHTCPARDRDEFWYKWRREEHLTEAAIRDRWNSMSDEERQKVSRRKWQRIDGKGKGSSLVKSAMKAAAIRHHDR